MEIAEESTNQIHSLKWRCWKAEIKRKKPVMKNIAAAKQNEFGGLSTYIKQDT